VAKMSPEEMAELEHKMLRVELHDLKECQIKFLSAAVVAAGLLLSFSNAVQSSEAKGAVSSDPLRIAYLIPLVVLIPCWWGFFDKAKTISRIVGYYRVLEGFLLGHLSVGQFRGRECSLGEFRRAELDKATKGYLESGSPRKHFLEAIFLIPSQRYWLLAEWTFAILSFASVGIPLTTIYARREFASWQSGVVHGAAVIVLYTLIWNVVILRNLMWRIHSYNTNFEKWCAILKVDKSAMSIGASAETSS
jgi:hypothetical protein